MNCQTATLLVEKKRDGKLTWSERMGLWMHTAYCSICALFFKQAEILDGSAKAYAQKIDTEQKSYKLNPDSKARMEEALGRELRDQG